MNAEVKKTWIAALRSKKYTQGRCNLRTIDDTFCCLGVLCELAVEQNVIPPATPPISWLRGGKNYEYEECDGYLPTSVLNWIQVEEGNVNTEHNNSMIVPGLKERDKLSDVTLTLLNDNGFSFDQIADIIEYFL